MYFVYLIQSIKNTEKIYTGYTINIQQHLDQHDFGASIYKSDHRPWKLVTYICFDDEAKALSFEKYLKVGSGHAFAVKRFW